MWSKSKVLAPKLFPAVLPSLSPKQNASWSKRAQVSVIFFYKSVPLVPLIGDLWLTQLFPSTSFVRSFALQASFCHDEDPNSSIQASVFLKSAQIFFQEVNSFRSWSFHCIWWVSFGLQMSHVIVNNEERMLPRNSVFSTEELPHLC